VGPVDLAFIGRLRAFRIEDRIKEAGLRWLNALVYLRVNEEVIVLTEVEIYSIVD